MADYVVLLPGTGLFGQNLPETGTGLKDIDGDGVNDGSLAILGDFGAVDASGGFGLGVAGDGAPVWRRAADLTVVGDGTARNEAYAGGPVGFRGRLNNSDDNWSKVNFSSGDGWVQWRFGADVKTLIPLLFVREAEGIDFSAAQAFRAAYNTAPTGTVTITGNATQGQTLTATNTLADVDGIPGAITYQWKANGSDITGATGNTLLLAQAQVDKVITVVASYTDGFGRAESVPSAPTAAIANVNDAPTGTVTITGTATQGQTLTATNTLADVDGIPGAITYTWFANGTSTGATGGTYTLAQTDVGKVFTVVAAYTDGFGTPEAVTSAPTNAVAPLPPVAPPPPVAPLPPVAPVAPPSIPDQIIALESQVLSVLSNGPTRLTVSLTGQGAASVLDIAMIRVDDAAGRIDGLLPSDGGYTAAALGRATTLMSALKAGDFVGQFGQRRIPVAPGQFLQFALIQSGTLDDLKRGGAGQIFFATGAANGNGQSGVQYSPTTTGLTMGFTLPGSAAPAVTLQLGLAPAPAPLGSQSQGFTAQSELLDLTGLAGPTATLSFEVFREASFNNVVGFYTVEDAQGRVRDPLTGNLLSPGEVGYQQAALANRVVTNLAGQNGQTLTYSSAVATGQRLSTFLVVNGTLDALLDATPANDPTVFFNYIAANADGQDHVRLLGDNTFGFEDILGGGDRDFNDVIVKVAVA